MTTALYAHADDTPAELRSAARDHWDPSACRALADWYRERGMPADPQTEEPGDEERARWLDVLAHEYEIRFIQARLIRTVLPQIPLPMPSRRRYSDHDLVRFFDQYGLP